METLSSDSAFDILLQSTYDDVLNLCKSYSIFFNICRKSYFWQQKALYDFGISAQAFNLLPGNNKARYEYLLSIDPNNGLFYSADVGNLELVNYFINRGARNYNLAARTAAKQGHIKIVNQMLQLGANDYNGVMITAAARGHRDIVDQMLQRGATDYYKALFWANEKGHQDIANLIRSYM